MNDDGTMARLADLVPFAQLHGLKIGTIADLIAYRRKYDHFVKRTVEAPFESHNGGAWTMYVYVNELEYAEHIALVKGDLSTPEPVLVRMHAVNIFTDMLEWKAAERDVAGRIHAHHRREGPRRGRAAAHDAADLRLRHRDPPRRRGHRPPPRQGIRRRRADPARPRRREHDPPDRYAEKKIVALEGYDLNIVGTHAIRGKERTP